MGETKTTVNQDYILPFLLDLGGSIISLYCNSATSILREVHCVLGRHMRGTILKHSPRTPPMFPWGLDCCDGARTDDWGVSWWVLRCGYMERHEARSVKWHRISVHLPPRDHQNPGVAMRPPCLDWMSLFSAPYQEETVRQVFVINLNSLHKGCGQQVLVNGK